MVKELLSTGSTLLNIACSNNVEGGFPKGSYIFFVGDSVSGKTWFALTCLAEASIDKRFDDYRFIHDDVEGGALMDMRRFFGERMFERLEPPARDGEGNPLYSQTVEEMYYYLDDALNDGRPFIWIEDSQDCLSSEAELAKFEEHKEAHEKGKEAAGAYGDNKAKVHSSKIRRLMGPLRDTGSILIMLNQTRDSFSIFEKSTHSGGRALRFYATLQLWSSVKEAIKRTVGGKERQLGNRCKIQIKKNRLTGRDRTVLVPIYHSFGVDDVGGCIDYLVEEGYWKKSKSGIVTKGMGPAVTLHREALVAHVEKHDLEEDLRDLVVLVWDKIEKACEVKRKARYA